MNPAIDQAYEQSAVDRQIDRSVDNQSREVRENPSTAPSHGQHNNDAVDTKVPSGGKLNHAYNVVTSRVSSQTDSDSAAERPASTNFARPWKTTFLRWAPLGGLASILVAITSIIVSLGILIGSHEAPVTSWEVEPSAVLAVCTAVANQALRFAAFQGFVVAWWFNASRGTTVRQLQNGWRSGTTFFGAFVAGRHMGLIGMACIFSTIVAIDGPLLQKATRVVNARITDHPLKLNVSMSPEIPRGYSGGWQRANLSQFHFSSEFNRTMPTANGHIGNNILLYYRTDIEGTEWNRPWLKDETVPGVVQGCESVCTATIRAPALTPTECTMSEMAVNYSVPFSLKTMMEDGAAPPLSAVGFMIAGGLILGEQENLNLITAYSDVQNCVGKQFMSVCTLKPAIGEYNVTIDHGKLTLGEEGPHIVALANNTQVSHSWDKEYGWFPSTLAGVASIALNRYEGAVSWFLYEGVIAGTVSGDGTPEIYALSGPGTGTSCRSYSDPKQDMIRSLNQLVFNVGAVAAREDESFLSPRLDPGLSVKTTVTGYLQGRHNIFYTDLGWFAAAAAIEAVCIALILPTYLGFWRLGRPVSFSPLEVAKVSSATTLFVLISSVLTSYRPSRLRSSRTATQTPRAETFPK